MRSLSLKHLYYLLAVAVAPCVDAASPSIVLSVQVPQRFSFAGEVVELTTDNPAVLDAQVDGHDIIITPQGSGVAEVKYRLDNSENYQYLRLEVDLGDAVAVTAPAAASDTTEAAADSGAEAVVDQASAQPEMPDAAMPAESAAETEVAVADSQPLVPPEAAVASAPAMAAAEDAESVAVTDVPATPAMPTQPAQELAAQPLAAEPVAPAAPQRTGAPSLEPPRMLQDEAKSALLADAIDQAAQMELSNRAPSQSADGAAMTLLAAVKRGVRMHPKVQSAIANVARAETEVSIAESSYWPTMELSAGPDLGGDVSYNLALTQTIYDWGQVSSGVEKASASKRERIQTLIQTQDDVALEVVNACIELKLARDNLSIVEFYQQQLDYLRQLVQERGASGYSDNTEISRVRQALGYADEQVATEMKRLLDSETNFRVLLDLEPKTQEVILPPVSNLFGMISDTVVLGRAINQAPDVRGAMEQVAQARSELDSASATLKPRLQLEATSQRRDVDGSATDDTVVGLRVRMNPMQGFSSFKQVTAQRQLLEQAQFEADTKRLELKKQVEVLGNQKRILSDQLNALNVQISQVENVRQTYRDQFMVGLRKIDDLISIERENFEAERQRLETISEYHRITYDAAAALGLLSPMLEGGLTDALQP